ncbi:hypothetical protein ABZ069_38015 [Streptomyces microflavus]|uniref:hypothetical protein n=1 Tax=Streptomyces microflavus TaxID=1919 RepID=UPI0033B339D3
MENARELSEASFYTLGSALARLNAAHAVEGAEWLWKYFQEAALDEAQDDWLQSEFLHFIFPASEEYVGNLQDAILRYVQSGESEPLEITNRLLVEFCEYYAEEWFRWRAGDTEAGGAEDPQSLAHGQHLARLLDGYSVAGVYSYPDDPERVRYDGEGKDEAAAEARIEADWAVANLRARADEVKAENRRALSAAHAVPNMPLYFIQDRAYTHEIAETPGIALVNPEGKTAEELGKITHTTKYDLFTAQVNIKRSKGRKVVVVTGAPSDMKSEIEAALLLCGTDKEIRFIQSWPDSPTVKTANRGWKAMSKLPEYSEPQKKAKKRSTSKSVRFESDLSS